ncbi:AEC family transporter [Hylemonella gracilis]|jgi:predicted permease|uniref:AEC family transporter n=1 Tax=Hylemonella gracilis TaxID=80880 RepID=A0A4P6UKH1_9BURK|nr:AEC family transporter [Hylemonella gracilis]QBK04620.1 AEC family transporter [Hylemonella gracilis]
MNSTVIAALVPVVLLVVLGYAAGRLRWLRAESAKDLSNLVFLVLMPALMFRTMGKVDIAHLDPLPLLGYFSAALLLFAFIVGYHGLHRLSLVRGAVLGVAATFSNLVMIGIAFMSLVYGDAGLVVLLSIVSVNALVLLTTGAVVLELAVAHEALRASQSSEVAQAGRSGRHALGRTVLQAVKKSLLHPVPIPIVAGLLYGQTGWGIPEMIDKPLQWLGNAMGPLALLLVGVTLAGARAREHLRGALVLTVVKNLVLPALVAGFGLLYGVTGLPLVVMVVAASLPAGANSFLFAQRYKVAEDLVTAGITASTFAALLTVPLVMALAARLG